MKDTTFTAISTFVQKHSGILLVDSKTYLIESRLTPVAQKFGLGDIDTLATRLPGAAPDLCNAVIDAMTTNESFFFRDATPFTLFEQIILPKLAAARRSTGRLRIWCAAASTGQEPYSLAMVLKSKADLLTGIQVEILGTDLSESALQRAREGRYTQFEVQRGLPIQLLVDNFTQDGTHWIISDEIRRMVRFSTLNLLDSYAPVGTVDVVFCRNVLIYFDVHTKRHVLEAIHKTMRGDGYLLLGAAETVMGVTDVFERADGQRGLYQPAASGAERLSA